MFHLTRPLFRKASTGLTGLAVHPNPLPTLLETYHATLSRLAEIPSYSAYRQGAEAIIQRKVKTIQDANGGIEVAEKELGNGQIEEAIQVAKDELNLVGKMIEWRAWEPLEEKPQPGQWEYFGKTTQFKL